MPVKKHIPQTNSSNDGASLPSVCIRRTNYGYGCETMEPPSLTQKRKRIFFFAKDQVIRSHKNGSLHKTSFSAHAKKKKEKKRKDTAFLTSHTDVVRGMRDDRTRSLYTVHTACVARQISEPVHFASETHVRVVQHSHACRSGLVPRASR